MGRKELSTVLGRASHDISFYSLLAEDPALAVQEYDLTEEERAALASVDVPWIEKHLGTKLDERTMTYVIEPLLSKEKW